MKRKIHTYKRKTSADKRNIKASFSEKITIQAYISVIIIAVMAITVNIGEKYSPQLCRKIKTAVSESITRHEAEAVFSYTKEKALEAGQMFLEISGQ